MPVPSLPTLGTPPAPAPLRKIALEEHFGHGTPAPLPFSEFCRIRAATRQPSFRVQDRRRHDRDFGSPLPAWLAPTASRQTEPPLKPPSEFSEPALPARIQSRPDISRHLQEELQPICSLTLASITVDERSAGQNDGPSSFFVQIVPWGMYCC